MKSFDAVVIGAGQAGPPLAARLTAAGKTVAYVERKLFGGTCVNVGCTPTKSMVASAYAAHLARRAAEYGVTGVGQVAVDIAAVRARRDAIVAPSRKGVEAWLRNNARISVFVGTATFESPTVVRVGDERIAGAQIFINVGARAAVPKLPGVQDVPFLTSTGLLALEVLPRHLVIVGGGYIGIELGQIYRRFGSEVTIIERGSCLLGNEDADVSHAVREILEAEGITVRTDADCISLARDGDGVRVNASCKGETIASGGSHVLLAMGRTPNTQDLGLDKAGVEVDRRGYITVDDECRTSAAHIWAMGDCNGRGAFTHTAYNDYEIVAANLLDGDARRVSDRISCYAVYLDPPLARIGMTEAEVRKTGRAALIGVRPMSRVNRAREKGETLGFMKVLVDAETKQVLGASLLGVGCDEAIHGLLDIMYAKAPYTTISRAVHIHPTVSELIPTVLQDLKALS
jgi:pyruvate/2-oxoglutarate dehydrogenase complex dihydrolipoamide dehydrogenase (E3) component